MIHHVYDFDSFSYEFPVIPCFVYYNLFFKFTIKIFYHVFLLLNIFKFQIINFFNFIFLFFLLLQSLFLLWASKFFKHVDQWLQCTLISIFNQLSHFCRVSLFFLIVFYLPLLYLLHNSAMFFVLVSNHNTYHCVSILLSF